MDSQTLQTAPAGGLPAMTYTREQLDLIKRTYAVGATDDELSLFVYAAKRLRLDILARQIHFTKRQGKPVFIVAIDGYRLNAERTEQYAPGREPSYTYDEKGAVKSATAYGKKFIGGEWHEIAATAFMEEYKPSDAGSAFMWNKMPHNQLAKCAEALMLRRGWPAELGDTITEDEAAQVREPEAKDKIESPKAKAPINTTAEKSDARLITDAQRKRFYAIWKGAGKDPEAVKAHLLEQIGSADSAAIPSDKYQELCDWAEAKA